MQQPQLVINDVNGVPRAFSLPVGSVVIGRSDAADIAVGPGNVSRRHAQLTWDGSQLRIEDLGSTNGTSVNGAAITRSVDLHDRDRIRLGTVEGYVIIPTPGLEDNRPSTLGYPLESQPRHVSPTRRNARSVFVSYSSSDRTKVKVFVDYLRDQGWHVLFDQDFLQPGEVWNQVIAEQIAACSAVLVLVSPASAGSVWVNKELVAATSAGRPILPVVIDSYGIGETRRRLAILGDRQWLTLDNPVDQLATDELDVVGHHLDRLAAGVRPDRVVSSRERLGSLIMYLGIVGLVATLGWSFTGFARYARLLVDVDFSSDDPFARVEEAWLDLLVAFPLFLASLVFAISGFVIRRNARKRRLMGG
jgi:pSer/pThr/pTyr-binding forkhead associated (FHA) protein